MRHVGQYPMDADASVYQVAFLLEEGVHPATTEAVNVQTDEVGEFATVCTAHQGHKLAALPAEVCAAVLFFDDQATSWRSNREVQPCCFLLAAFHLCCGGRYAAGFGLLLCGDTCVDGSVQGFSVGISVPPSVCHILTPRMRRQKLGSLWRGGRLGLFGLLGEWRRWHLADTLFFRRALQNRATLGDNPVNGLAKVLAVQNPAA